MPQTDTPLRYPGGKSALFPTVKSLLLENGLYKGHYAEPYAGGCGLALTLMLNGYVQELHLNDIDRALASFWKALIFKTDELKDMILSATVTIEEWEKQKAVFRSSDATEIDLAFATLFLNRTNRSGILKGGVIGGRKQDGKYKLDCRFNKVDLVRKINRISLYKHRIHFSNLDAIEFMEELKASIPQKSLINIDPPYFAKGSSLYTNYYRPEDHVDIAECVAQLGLPWIITYDNVSQIRELYCDYRQQEFALNYSAANKRRATEIMIFSDQLNNIQLQQAV